MNKVKLFSNSLVLEVYLIGYPSQGESVVFFLKADGKVSYTGVVDCFKHQSINKTLEILQKEGVSRIDFLCWTHPHEDHSLDIDRLLQLYCDNNTKIWLTDIYPDELETCGFSKSSILMYSSIKKKIGALNSNIKFAKDNTILDRLRFEGREAYLVEIESFAPNSTIIAERKERQQKEEGNPYSIGLSIFAGRFNVMLCGDVENPTIERFEDIYFEAPVDYIKIPHHGSPTSDMLPNKLRSFGIKAPSVATSTVYNRHNLPEDAVLKEYQKWGTSEIYISSNPKCMENEDYYGIILTTIDVLEQKEYPIETMLLGNAYCYS